MTEQRHASVRWSYVEDLDVFRLTVDVPTGVVTNAHVLEDVLEDEPKTPSIASRYGRTLLDRAVERVLRAAGVVR